jgi:hypothetical protein
VDGWTIVGTAGIEGTAGTANELGSMVAPVVASGLIGVIVAIGAIDASVLGISSDWVDGINIVLSLRMGLNSERRALVSVASDASDESVESDVGRLGMCATFDLILESVVSPALGVAATSFVTVEIMAPALAAARPMLLKTLPNIPPIIPPSWTTGPPDAPTSRTVRDVWGFTPITAIVIWPYTSDALCASSANSRERTNI